MDPVFIAYGVGVFFVGFWSGYALIVEARTDEISVCLFWHRGGDCRLA